MLLRLLNRFTFRIPAILYTAIRDFIHLRSSEAAASMAYYALFSLFPLLIFLISILSFFLEEKQVQTQVMTYLHNLFPISDTFVAEIIDQNLTDLVERNIEHLVDVRGYVGILAAVSLLWSSSNFFTALARNINRTWHTTAAPLSFLHGRLVAFLMICALALLLLVSLIGSAALTILARIQTLLWDSQIISNLLAWKPLVTLIPPVITFALFFSLYRWVPNTQVKSIEALWGALAATALWRLAVFGFSWAINIGLVNFQLIYGSLATLIVGVIWIYIGSLIVLFGAHLSAAIAIQTRLRRLEESERPPPTADRGKSKIQNPKS